MALIGWFFLHEHLLIGPPWYVKTNFFGVNEYSKCMYFSREKWWRGQKILRMLRYRWERHRHKFSSPYRVDINAAVDCNTSNVIYCIECMKPSCRLQYIGQTSEPLKIRFNQHRGYVRNEALSKATGLHFNGSAHKISDMKVTIVEKVYNKCEFFRKRRESYYIRKFNSKHQGINRITWC